MKQFKKIAALLLSLVMCLSLCVTAFADDGTYTITINSEKTGHTYEAYQIFSGTLSENGKTLSDVQWGSGIDGTNFLEALKKDETLGSLFTNCSSAADVAEVLASDDFTTENLVAFAALADSYLTTTVAGTSTASSTTYTISNLTAGYYLVKDKDGSVTAAGDAYTRNIIRVVGNVEVSAKVGYPTIDKAVSDNDTYIGGTVTFTLTGTVPDTTGYETYTYIFHDTLSSGLTVDETSFVVKMGDTTLTADKDYTVKCENGTITVTMTMSASDLSNKTIVVTYNATLNKNAVIGNDGNTNTVYVEYSNNPNSSGSGDDGDDEGEPSTGKTPESKVYVFTYELDGTKVDGSDSTVTLQGAQFVLQNAEGKYYQLNSSTNEISWVNDKSDATIITSGEDGTFSIVGLDVGTYTLTETKAPDGYNLLKNSIKIVVSATYSEDKTTVESLTITVDDGTATNGDTTTGVVEITVENNAGSTLPGTGGMGTTIFYVVGCIMMAGAAVLLITKKRMGKAD